jgi:hypothetical protein
VNLGLAYDDPSTGFGFNLQFNRFGSRIVEVATLYEEDIVERSRNALDVSFTQRITQGIECKLSVKDVFAEDQVYLQGDRIARVNQRGSTVSLGVSLSF